MDTTPSGAIPAEMIAAAKEEGSPTVYGAAPTEDGKYWVEDLDERFSVSGVSYNQMGEPDIWSRITSEFQAGSVAADAALGGGLGGITTVFQNTDALRPIPDNVIDVIEEVGYPESAYGEYYAPGYALPIVTYYNTDMMSESELPESYLGLTEDRFANELSMESPVTLGGTDAFFATLQKELGKSTFEEWAQGLLDNDILLTTSGGAAFNPIANGEKMMGFGLINDLISARQRGEDLPVDIAWKTMNPLAVEVQFPQALTGDAPKPNAGELWMAHGVTPEGQRSVAEWGSFPVKPEIKQEAFPNLLPDGFEFKAAAFNVEDYWSSAEEWQTYFEELGFDV
jgi:ABC-type Fe3+ transport system substrate-binding protein